MAEAALVEERLNMLALERVSRLQMRATIIKASYSCEAPSEWERRRSHGEY